MLSEERIIRELASLKNSMDGLRRRVSTLQNKHALIGEEVAAVGNHVQSFLKRTEELNNHFFELKKNQTVVSAKEQEQDEQTTTIMKDAVVNQMGTKLAELLDALGFGKEHIQKHGLDETVYDACLYVQSLKGSESVLNNLRSMLK